MVRAAAEMAAHSIPCRIIPLEALRVHGGRALQRRICNQGAGYPEREQKGKSRCAHEDGRPCVRRGRGETNAIRNMSGGHAPGCTVRHIYLLCLLSP